MDVEELELALILFKLKVYQSEGNTFEDFFLEIMKSSNGNIKPVKPRGRFGDKKNDGFDKKAGVYYQVFAPLHPQDSYDEAVKKCKKDFKGLYAHWQSISEINEFYFVYNDKYKGTDSELEKELSLIKKDYDLNAADTFLAQDLQRIFMGLDDFIKRRIVGHIPRINSEKVIEYSDISEILDHILNYEISDEAELSYERNPEFFEKIQLNKFSDSVAKLLDKANFQIYAIEDFFKKNGTHKRELFAKKLSSIYDVKIKESTFDKSDENYSDMIFFQILQDIKPDNRGTITDASLSLMSYYFETCDIFETE